MPKRVYQDWKGNNVFLFDGRLILGGGARSLPITLLLIILPAVIFCVFVASHLRHEFYPYNAGYVIMVVAIVFTILVLLLLFRVSTGDPGIVPRNSHPPEEELGYRYDISPEDDDSRGRQRLPRTRQVMVNGFPVTVKYCNTCMIYRPPRSSHCAVCNNCVELFDHHCPWLGQCIGLRNYRYFVFFIATTTLLTFYVFTISAYNIKVLIEHKHRMEGRALKGLIASVVLMVYCFIFSLFIGGLTGFHFYLICTNQTTYERYKFRNRNNAYNSGCLRNFYRVFCSKVKPSEHNFRAYLQQRLFSEERIEDHRDIVENDL